MTEDDYSGPWCVTRKSYEYCKSIPKCSSGGGDYGNQDYGTQRQPLNYGTHQKQYSNSNFGNLQSRNPMNPPINNRMQIQGRFGPMTLKNELTLGNRRNQEFYNLIHNLESDVFFKLKVQQLMERNFSDTFQFYRKTNYSCEEIKDEFYKVFVTIVSGDRLGIENIKHCQSNPDFTVSVDGAIALNYVLHIWNWFCFLIIFVIFQKVFISPIDAWITKVTGKPITPNSDYKLNSYLYVQT